MRSKTQTLILLLLFVIAQLTAMAKSSTPLRRPISPNQPTWFVHIDTWNFADPLKGVSQRAQITDIESLGSLPAMKHFV
jgi:Glycosyl hydrolase family 98